MAMCVNDERSGYDDRRWFIKNYFKTEKDAKDSAIYKLLNQV